jgi:hypothetical protein
MREGCPIVVAYLAHLVRKSDKFRIQESEIQDSGGRRKLSRSHITVALLERVR